MTRESKSPKRVRFGAFELDCSNGELSRNGTSLKLQPQPARVLCLLVKRAREIVTRQEIAEQVWGSDTFVNFEQGLNFAIRQIRTALEDDPDHPVFVETLPRRGYRFIAEVESVGEQTGVGSELVDKTAASGNGKQPIPQFWKLMTLGLTAVCLFIALVVVYRLRSHREARAASQIQSIAVLPLVNLSADPAQEYFSDGLTDELITELAKTGQLRVISRTSVVALRGSRKRTPEIGQELHVDAIVEGTVERVGNRVRIRAQLIRAETDQHLWAEVYDRDLSDLLALERDVARDIARQIGLRLSQNEQTATKVTAAAHEDYLLGRYYWNKRTESGLRKGIEYFQKAIDQQPNYALAYAGLADSYVMLANWGFADPADSYQKAKAAASTALELDNRLVEAHSSLAYVTLLYDWDWQSSESRFRQAIVLDPNYVSAHHFYSILLMASGRQAEAVAEIRHAQQLDPLSLIVNDVVGWIYYENRDYDQAIQQYRKTLEMDPNYTPALLDLGTAYLRRGDYRDAIVQFEKASRVSGNNGVVLSNIAQAYALSGDRARAQRILKQLQGGSGPRFVSSWDLSLIYAALGEKKKSLALLQKAVDDHVGWVVRLGVDPAFDNLRTEPEFQMLLRRLGVPTKGAA